MKAGIRGSQEPL